MSKAKGVREVAYMDVRQAGGAHDHAHTHDQFGKQSWFESLITVCTNIVAPNVSRNACVPAPLISASEPNGGNFNIERRAFSISK